MNDPYADEAQPRVWRQDRGAMFAGVCSGLADDLDLPLPLVRMVTVLFVFLPTGLAYLALGLLLRRRMPNRRTQFRSSGTTFRTETGAGATTRPQPVGQSYALLRHRFETLEPRLGRIEAFVTSSDFELHRGFRRMGQ
ncbi:PspC domain-containing protein [Lichenicola sp.]|uniref:PspC domain-containing protein n=1 Tax=Lichenicola sp. TaxID=2804529 RepID=UPI003B00B176